MGKFGWSYPPGCSGLPDQDERPCVVCGGSIDDCLCPECPKCGVQGDPMCYERHGMVRSTEQKKQLADHLMKVLEQSKINFAADQAESEYWEAQAEMSGEA
jgi:hypothetical protein